MAEMEENEEEEPPLCSSSDLSVLPRDILYSIFNRLSIKSLHRLRCVCSRWLSLLNDREFISLYHQNHRINPLLICCRSRSTYPSVTATNFSVSCFSASDSTRRFRFELSLTGRLITVISSLGILCLISDSQPLIFDPITGRSSNLPYSPQLRLGTFASAAFGYVASSREFKIVHLYTMEKFDNYHYESVKETACEILTVPCKSIGFDCSIPSLESEEWRFLGKCPVDILARKPQAVVDGRIYWLVAEKKFNPDGVRILRFDLKKEKFELVCFPRMYSNRSVECVGLLEINEKLCLTDRIPWESGMGIWELVDSRKDIWIKKYEIDMGGFCGFDLEILGFCNWGSYAGIMIKSGENDFVLYDVKEGRFRGVAIEKEEAEDEDEVEDGYAEEEEFHLLLTRKDML